MDRKIAVVGLGYVGLPVAVAFGKRHPVVGFDIKAARIAELREGRDSTEEVAPRDLAEAEIRFTDRVEDLKACDFFIVAVPTPVDEGNKPDLSPLVTKLRRARPDVILHTGYNPDITLFLRQSKEQGLKWDALIGHGAGYGQFDKLYTPGR